MAQLQIKTETISGESARECIDIKSVIIHLNQGTTTNHDRDYRWPTRLQARLHALGEIDTLPIHCIIHLVRGWRMGFMQ